jgi:hypothetical protein
MDLGFQERGLMFVALGVHLIENDDIVILDGIPHFCQRLIAHSGIACWTS